MGILTAVAGTILRWSGAGMRADLEKTTRRLLEDSSVSARVTSSGRTLVVAGPPPVKVASIMQHLPGVSWIAVGYVGRSIGDLTKSVAALAPRYLRRGDEFSVDAEAAKGEHPSDVSGALTSAILDAVGGVRVSQSQRRVVFRAALDGQGGAVGVQIKEGPGGVPTGRSKATCLVSGGVHSSVVAWMTMLSGARVTLVHASSGEDGIRGVARLYSELSHRGDPRWVRLVVLEGAPQAPLLYEYITTTRGPVFGGFTAAGGAPPATFGGKVAAPLFVATERYFADEFAGLGISPLVSTADWEERGDGHLRVMEFGGKRADVSEVIDGLEPPQRRRNG